MKQFLCLKDGNYRKAGSLYPDCNGFGPDLGQAVVPGWSKDFIEVETFERDGMEWIKHDGGDCPVLGQWIIKTVSSAEPYRADFWNWYSCEWDEPDFGYHIISTGEQERQFKSEEHREMVEYAEEFKSVHGDGCCSCHISPPCSYCTHSGNPLCLESAGYDENGNPLGSGQEFDISMDNWKEVSGRDYRPLSPPETPSAAKMAEKDEDESGAGGGKTFPSSALRDMSDKTFANLLGMGQFIGGGE